MERASAPDGGKRGENLPEAHRNGAFDVEAARSADAWCMGRPDSFSTSVGRRKPARPGRRK